MTLAAEQIFALRLIKTLRCGTANALSARAISIGTRDVENKLVSASKAVLAGDAKGKMVLVEGDWGTGKSHLRALLSGHLVEMDIPFIYTNIDARGASLAHIHRIMPIWLNLIRIGAASGLRDLFYHDILPRNETIKWTSRRQGPFAEGLRMALGDDSFGWQIALGHFFEAPDSSYQHEKALSLVLSCAELFNSVGRGGIVLLLDEAENIDKQFDIRGRRKSYDTLWQFVQHPHIIPILFVTRRLYSQITADIAVGRGYGWNNWTQYAKSFVLSFENFEILRPPRFDAQMSYSLMEKIEKVFSIAYGKPYTKLSTESVFSHWKQTPTRTIRLLLRMTINELDILKQNGRGF
jgi:hypothetical protein